MTPEEQKLIEEWKKISSGSHEWCGCADGDVYHYFDEQQDKAIEFILKAYHSGKRAGFEVCEKLANDIDNDNEFINVRGSEKYVVSVIISKVKSLIEEEKSKL